MFPSSSIYSFCWNRFAARHPLRRQTLLSFSFGLSTVLQGIGVVSDRRAFSVQVLLFAMDYNSSFNHFLPRLLVWAFQGFLYRHWVVNDRRGKMTKTQRRSHYSRCYSQRPLWGSRPFAAVFAPRFFFFSHIRSWECLLFFSHFTRSIKSDRL